MCALIDIDGRQGLCRRSELLLLCARIGFNP